MRPTLTKQAAISDGSKRLPAGLLCGPGGGHPVVTTRVHRELYAVLLRQAEAKGITPAQFARWALENVLERMR